MKLTRSVDNEVVYIPASQILRWEPNGGQFEVVLTNGDHVRVAENGDEIQRRYDSAALP